MILIGFTLLFAGGLFGLASALLRMRMVDELNAQRPADDQIPFAIMSFRDWTWLIRHHGWSGLGLLREYRQTFPNSRVSAQWIACVISMFGLVLVALALLRFAAARTT